MDRSAADILDSIEKKKLEALHLQAEEVVRKDHRNGLENTVQDQCVKIALQLISEAAFLLEVLSTLSKHGTITEGNQEQWR